jgi:hypothetical protein
MQRRLGSAGTGAPRTIAALAAAGVLQPALAARCGAWAAA